MLKENLDVFFVFATSNISVRNSLYLQKCDWHRQNSTRNEKKKEKENRSTATRVGSHAVKKVRG